MGGFFLGRAFAFLFALYLHLPLTTAAAGRFPFRAVPTHFVTCWPLLDWMLTVHLHCLPFVSSSTCRDVLCCCVSGFGYSERLGR